MVYVAEAANLDRAREIRKQLWNLGAAPFLIVLLPDQVRAYAGFIYDQDPSKGLLRSAKLSSPNQIAKLLEEYGRRTIDSGMIWETNRKALRLNHRIDEHLLRNLRVLSRRLQKEFAVSTTMAHSLIGKFIYINYLRHRGILSDDWLKTTHIEKEKAWGTRASPEHLEALVERLEDRFGGRVFPLSEDLPSLSAIQFLARVFAGEEAATGQTALDFGIYDFSYIPIELLSSVYEHFLRETESHRSSGAVYTPEYLADYVLSQANAVRPLELGMRVLDPCCGSGVFLVLALRRLIEGQLVVTGGQRLSPDALAKIVQSSIFGVERNIDACYVAEFGLLLTLLSYLEPPDLYHYPHFRFPNLHDRNIYHGDFFDPDLPISGERFDLVIGNPPWLETSASGDQQHLVSWISENAATRPTPRLRTSEAFTWRAAESLQPEGVCALVLPATTLFNAQLKEFRQAFFAKHTVRRITNFANLAYVLFAGRADAPAFTIVFETTLPNPDHSILHFGPFVAQHPMLRVQKRRRRAWTVTVNDREVSSVPQVRAADGGSLSWKLALWGSERHERNLRKLKVIFPLTLSALCRDRELDLGLGVQLRTISAEEATVYIADFVNRPVLVGEHLVRSKALLTVPDAVLGPALSASEAYVRKRGGVAGVSLAKAPHVVVGPLFCAFSSREFVVPHPKIAVADSSGEQHDLLRALSLYMASSVAQYLLFFRSVRWGIDRRDLVLEDVLELPCPALDDQTMVAMAASHRELAKEEEASGVTDQLLHAIDATVGEHFVIPEQIQVMAEEFRRLRMPMDKGQVPPALMQTPDEALLRSYRHRLKQELDAFSGFQHQVDIGQSNGFLCCMVQPAVDTHPDQVPMEFTDWSVLLRPESDWMYVQRSLRIFDGQRFTVCKPARTLSWTQTAAIEDSDDIITEILSLES